MKHNYHYCRTINQLESGQSVFSVISDMLEHSRVQGDAV